MSTQFYEWCGKIIVVGLGGAAGIAGLGFLLWLAGWGFVELVTSPMKSFGFYKAFVQMRQTHRAWAVWAATVCREDREVRDGMGGVIDLKKLRKFFEGYDPNNDYEWKRP